MERAEAYLHDLIGQALPMSLSIRTNSLIARTLGIGTQNIFSGLDATGYLGEMRGPFAGQPLNPFQKPLEAEQAKATPRPSSDEPGDRRKRPVPKFQGDHSLRSRR